MRSMIQGLLSFGCALVAGAGLAQEPAFHDSTSVVVVELPVTVTLKGEALRDLTAKNFEVWEGKSLRPLIGFEVVDLSQSRPVELSLAASGLPIAARRHFLLYFDLTFSTNEALVRSIGAARELVETGLHPSDLVGVAIYSSSLGTQQLIDFTPDHSQASKVLDMLDHLVDRDVPYEFPSAGEDDALGLMARDIRSLAAQIGRAAGTPESTVGEFLRDGSVTGGDRASAILNEILEEMAAEEGAALRQRRRGEIESLAMSLEHLAQRTGGVAGSKHLVLFSGGFDPYVFEAGGSGILGSLRRSIEALRRAGWSIQGVDSDRRSVAAGTDDDAEGLLMLANETGGDHYRGFNRLSDAMDRMLTKTEVTYLLAFQVDPGMAEGGFHPVRVRLRDVPRGAKARHRSGYTLEPVARDPQSARLEAVQLLLSGRVREDIATAVLAVPFKSGVGSPRVSVVLQIDGRELLEGQSESTLAAEVFGYVFAADGTIADHFGQRFSIDLEGRRTVLASRGLKVFGDLELASGRYSLRLLVRNPLSGRFTTKSAPIDVPSFDDDAARLMPPLFIDPESGPTVFLDGGSRQRATGERYLFRLGDRTFIPAVVPTLDRQSLVRICVPVYALDPEHQSLQAELLRADGSALAASLLTVIGRDGPDDQGLSQLLLSLEAEALPPDDYALRVALIDRATGSSSVTATPFTVGLPW